MKKLFEITRFKPGEFPEDPEEHASPKFLLALNVFALLLGHAVYPSPVSGALARFDGDHNSCHLP